MENKRRRARTHTHRRTEMPRYLITATYSGAALKAAMTDSAEKRAAVVEGLMKSVGGTVVSLHFTSLGTFLGGVPSWLWRVCSSRGIHIQVVSH